MLHCGGQVAILHLIIRHLNCAWPAMCACAPMFTLWWPHNDITIIVLRGHMLRGINRLINHYREENYQSLASVSQGAFNFKLTHVQSGCILIIARSFPYHSYFYLLARCYRGHWSFTWSFKYVYMYTCTCRGRWCIYIHNYMCMCKTHAM